MDLLEQSKKGNKDSFIGLASQYNHIFYKTSRLFFTNDKDIEEVIKNALVQTFVEITNISAEKDFLSYSLQILILKCNETQKTKALKTRKKSFVEEQISHLIEYLRMPTLLYYYADLSICEISKILKISDQETTNFVAEARIKLSEILKEKELLTDITKSTSNEEIDKSIKKLLKSDTSFGKNIFNNFSKYFYDINVEQQKYSYKQKNIFIFIIICLIFITFYCISKIIPNNINSSNIIFQNTNNLENINKGTFKPNFDNTEKNITSVKNNTNIANYLNEISITNATSDIKTNIFNTNKNKDTNNVVEPTQTPIKTNTSKPISNTQATTSHFNETDLEVFMENYAVGIERISYEEETLESNTILLYIAEQYFSTKSNKSSLSINTTYATTATNVHKYLSEITSTDYTKLDRIKAYNNYIRYSASSKSYLYGTDYSILLKENYDCSNLSILDKKDDIYTAQAKVTRTIDEQQTNYDITFTFKLNTNYTYEKFKILSLKAKNTSFTTDNTVHFVDLPSEEDEKK